MIDSKQRRRFLRCSVGLGASLAGAATLPGIARAQGAAYPVKPIRVIVPFAAGSATDIMMRQLEPVMSRSLGQPLIIDNRVGAVGITGTDQMRRTAPDGYTVAMSSISAFALAAATRPKTIPYDIVKDFTPIGRACTSTNVVCVHPSVPATNLAELIAYSKTLPSGLSFTSGGVGGSNHLAGEMLKLKGANIVHVPYSNQSQAVTDTVAGHVPVLIYTVAVTPFVKSGKLRALAVTSERRQRQAPEIPTAVEQGMTDMVANSWFALFGPAGMPATIRDRLYQALREALTDTVVADKLVAAGLEPAPLPPDELRAFVEKEYATWKDVVIRAKVQIDGA